MCGNLPKSAWALKVFRQVGAEGVECVETYEFKPKSAWDLKVFRQVGAEGVYGVCESAAHPCHSSSLIKSQAGLL